jgi:hypothetical protein
LYHHQDLVLRKYLKFLKNLMYLTFQNYLMNRLYQTFPKILKFLKYHLNHLYLKNLMFR